jgi:hypothetical protein
MSLPAVALKYVNVTFSLLSPDAGSLPELPEQAAIIDAIITITRLMIPNLLLVMPDPPLSSSFVDCV